MSERYQIPGILEESHAGIREISLYSEHFKNRRIFILGTIDDNAADDFIMQFTYLEGESTDPIHIVINSGGGSVSAGLAIYDTIRASAVPVNIYCAGMASSMAAVLLAGGQKGRRYILPHSKVMIHEPLIRDGLGGSATSIHNISESIMETREIVNGILAQHTGRLIEEIHQATAYDHYMNATESVAFGICDEIRSGVFK